MRQRTRVTVPAAAIARGGMYDTQRPWKAIDTGGASDTARHPADNTTGRPMTEIDENEQGERT
jgi:hypothetical protein